MSHCFNRGETKWDALNMKPENSNIQQLKPLICTILLMPLSWQWCSLHPFFCIHSQNTDNTSPFMLDTYFSNGNIIHEDIVILLLCSVTRDIYYTSVRPGRGFTHSCLSLWFFWGSFSLLLLRITDRGCCTLSSPMRQIGIFKYGF